MRAPVLTTERLVLRQIAPDDLELHMQHLNTPQVMAYLGGVMPRERIAEKHARTADLWAQSGFGFMMMEERASGELVGHCGMKRVDHPLAPNPGDHEIGWLVREDRWRRGYAFEAMRAVVDWGFTAFAAPRIVALTAEKNLASRGLMEKLGMERRPELDFNDPAMPPAYSPTIQYAITRGQWGPSLD